MSEIGSCKAPRAIPRKIRVPVCVPKMNQKIKKEEAKSAQMNIQGGDQQAAGKERTWPGRQQQGELTAPKARRSQETGKADR